MGFADAYLRKASLREMLIEDPPNSGTEIIVTIPVYHESGLERCLDSLFQCDTSGIRGEAIILVNAPADAPGKILEQNRQTCHATRQWIKAHSHPDLDFHVLLDHTFSRREAGVGLARKILMDEAARRFSLLDKPGGIIASMDADAVVEKNYLQALAGLFRREHPDGCSVYFEHPVKGSEFGEDTYGAIMQYELHQRYYLRTVRSTGYPHAFHTVGSCFAVRADVYCKEGGMNRRKGGEDFYFIQKIAQRGNFIECNDTCVVPSPRPSGRVPFGTGPVVRRLMDDPGSPLYTYDPRPFAMLGEFFGGLNIMYTGVIPDHFMKSLSPVLLDFLDAQNFGEALVEMRKHSASPVTFQKRFWRWFNMFRILKFIHHARKHRYPDIPVREAAIALLRQTVTRPVTPDSVPSSATTEERNAATTERNAATEETISAAKKIIAGAGQGIAGTGQKIAGTGQKVIGAGQGYENTSTTRSLLEIYRQWDRSGPGC